MIDVNFEKKVFLRDEFGRYLLEKGSENSKIVVVNADLMGTS